MTTSMTAELPVYRELADLYQQQSQSQLRDRFLLLAANAAHEAGNENEADRWRQRLLQFNPHHMIKPFSSFADALRSPDVQSYVRDLKQSYPLATAHQMLAGLRQAALRHDTPARPAPPPEPTPYRMLPPAPLARAPMGASARATSPLPRTGRLPVSSAPPDAAPQHNSGLATVLALLVLLGGDRKSTRLNSSHIPLS